MIIDTESHGLLASLVIQMLESLARRGQYTRMDTTLMYGSLAAPSPRPGWCGAWFHGGIVSVLVMPNLPATPAWRPCPMARTRRTTSNALVCSVAIADEEPRS
ncbi:MAG: hypothetical protein HC923_02270 [Myxococcales bacterium]|nr:hypothetical protein [Myxococcales bacterium]